MNGNFESFETLIRKSFKYPIYQLSEIWICKFYRNNFYKNNRWNKSVIVKYYSELPENLRADFKTYFSQNFELNKTNQNFLKIISDFENSDLVQIEKQDLLNIIESLIELKNGKSVEVKRGNKKVTEQRKIKITFKSLAKGLSTGFSTGYSQAYIEDLLRQKAQKASTRK